MKRFWTALAGALLAIAAHAQAPAPKIAITSLVADVMNITMYRERTGTNISNANNAVKMPGPLLDIAVLKAAQDGIAKSLPGATVFPLKVAAAGSNLDPAAIYADGKVLASHVLVDALRQQGFTHLVTATKLRHTNVVRLNDGVIGTGQLEGVGFYLDPRIRVQNVKHGDVAEGIIAPYVYIQLRLVDLATAEVRGTHDITANAVASTASNPAGVDAWGAMTAQEKFDALDRLIKENVAAAMPVLFQVK